MASDRYSAAPAVTALIERWARGDAEAEAALLPLLLPALRARAARLVAQDDARGVAQATQLVDDACMRARAQRTRGFHDRWHLLRVCRRFLLHAWLDERKRARRLRRGGDVVTEPLPESVAAEEPRADLATVLSLRDLLGRLVARGEPQASAARLIELRFFEGLSEEEAAARLGLSRSAASHRWLWACAWLKERLAAAS